MLLIELEQEIWLLLLIVRSTLLRNPDLDTTDSISAGAPEYLDVLPSVAIEFFAFISALSNSAGWAVMVDFGSIVRCAFDYFAAVGGVVGVTDLGVADPGCFAGSFCEVCGGN